MIKSNISKNKLTEDAFADFVTSPEMLKKLLYKRNNLLTCGNFNTNTTNTYKGYKFSVHKTTKEIMNDRATELRNNLTYSEEIFLKEFNKLNINFKFQFPINIGINQNYIIDFYFPKEKLVVEIDGYFHKHNILYDLKRDYLLLKNKYITTIRIKSENIRNFKSVRKIKEVNEYIETNMSFIKQTLNSKKKRISMNNELINTINFLEENYNFSII